MKDLNNINKVKDHRELVKTIQEDYITPESRENQTLNNGMRTIVNLLVEIQKTGNSSLIELLNKQPDKIPESLKIEIKEAKEKYKHRETSTKLKIESETDIEWDVDITADASIQNTISGMLKDSNLAVVSKLIESIEPTNLLLEYLFDIPSLISATDLKIELLTNADIKGDRNFFLEISKEDFPKTITKKLENIESSESQEYIKNQIQKVSQTGTSALKIYAKKFPNQTPDFIKEEIKKAEINFHNNQILSPKEIQNSISQEIKQLHINWQFRDINV